MLDATKPKKEPKPKLPPEQKLASELVKLAAPKPEEVILNALPIFLSQLLTLRAEKKELKAQKDLKKKETLLSKLKKLAQKSSHATPDHAEEVEKQMKADDLLLEYIGDDKITKTFNKRFIYYP